MARVSVVIPNWNGVKELPDCLDSLLAQSLPVEIIIVDNGSVDGSIELLASKYNQVKVIALPHNIGFAGGVNAGLQYAAEADHEFTALLNNDAVADKDWIKNLVKTIETDQRYGIVTSKILDDTGKYIDSTGDLYTIWGLPYPRGRKETDINRYDALRDVFGASGGASLYRHKMLADIGLFDEDFFAYYEDVDLSFRAQLSDWKIAYEPKAVVFHHIGATSDKIIGFTTYQTMKNLPWLLIKNVPISLSFKVIPRLSLVYILFGARALTRGQGWPALKGFGKMILLLPKMYLKRFKIQKQRKVSVSYISSILVYDLPPNARTLRKMRLFWWKLIKHS